MAFFTIKNMSIVYYAESMSKNKNHGPPSRVSVIFPVSFPFYPFSRSAITAKASLATSTVSAMSASVRLALMKWLW